MNYLYLVKRTAIALLSVFIVVSVVFGITTLLPGSAANIVLGTEATEQSIQQVNEELGLDRPLPVQYVDFVGGVMTGDFGESLISGQPVMEMVWPRLLRTLQLAAVAMLISVVVAIPLGILAASERDTIVDHVVTSGSYVGLSIPSFVSATLLLLFLTTPPLELFPKGGFVPISEGMIPWLHHLLLPAIAMNTIILAYILRQTRSSMVETLESDYIRTARLKGVAERNVLFKHGLRNGLLPTVTVLALNFGWMMGSVVIIEQIFAFPGMGELIVQAIDNRDLPVIQAGILVPTIAFIFANFAADVIYTMLDPRISLGDE
ncbi:ABC transporter permease [Halorubellus sp. JP-L1]|uniref:ABC transporter permease n=1 Tax=Halorubellus sp. JP-L1 TaxID=2715753 RepID=UPI00140CF008|nr:ABC transporter permease [Halorubellus sp. JP-L1]NHN42942.1 ABC transporter permease [Halorubellus sp. JP-L1]